MARRGGRLSRGALGIVLALIAAQALGAAQAWAQTSTPATVSRVIDGDTLVARLPGDREITVQLIGVDTPETVEPGTPVECGGPEATEALRMLADGQPVNLVSDSGTFGPFDLDSFYVDRAVDGVDVGEQMLSLGWGTVRSDQGFDRLRRYWDARGRARYSDIGAWQLCDGDFHRPSAEGLRRLKLSAVAFMRRYYRRISNHQFATAGGMLARPLRRKLGPFSSWRAGYRRSLGVSVLSARARLSGRRAVVSVRLRARDRDACSGRVVSQRFRGHWTLAPRRDAWVMVRVQMRKTSGGSVRLSKSECPAPLPPPPPPPPTDCQGYSPCLPPGPDVDCAGGSGNGPRYVDGPVYVNGSDPYDLDGNNDGVGCTS